MRFIQHHIRRDQRNGQAKTCEEQIGSRVILVIRREPRIE
jgi:hypothetical protein